MSDNEDLFDPNSYDLPSGEGGGGKKYDRLEEAGEYLLGIERAIEHNSTKNGKLFTKFAFVVIEGPQKGRSFLDRVFRSASAYKRLAAICRAVRVTEKFDPKKDSEMERIFEGRSLKASVKINENGYAELEWPQYAWTSAELATLDAWSKERKESAKKKAQKALADAGDFDDAPLEDFDDDEIPF